MRFFRTNRPGAFFGLASSLLSYCWRPKAVDGTDTFSAAAADNSGTLVIRKATDPPENVSVSPYQPKTLALMAP